MSTNNAKMCFVLNVYNLSEDWLWVVSNYGHATRHLVCQSDGYFVCLYLFVLPVDKQAGQEIVKT